MVGSGDFLRHDGVMEATDRAQALYKDTAESASEHSVDALALALERRAREVREGVSQETRGQVADALQGMSPEERKEVEKTLNQAARALRTVFEGAAPTLKRLEGDTAGEAQLESSVIRIDPIKIVSEDGEMIDRQKAEDILDHEREHTQQSSVADATEITIGAQKFDVREIREAAAISVQDHIDFLSDEYRSIAQRLTMNDEEREMVRKGRFKALEARKNNRNHIALAA